MFSHTDLQELLSFEVNGNKKVLSLYLNADISQDSRETIKQRAKSLLREAGPEFAEDAAVIERYMDHSYDWSKPGLAIFSCAAHDFLRIYPAGVAFRNRLRLQNKPYVKPVAHLLDFYAHYGVILVDRVGARFFEYHLGELQHTEGSMGEEVGKPIGDRQHIRVGNNGDRQENEVVQRNWRQIAADATEFFTSRQVRRLFLGGTAENVAQFRDHLPKQLQSCVAGTFSIDMDASETEVKARSLTLLQEVNAKREEELVQNMVTTAAKNGNAVTGLPATLHSAYEGRVQTLIISDGYRVPGYVYKDSGYLSASLVIDRPEAVGEPQEVEDVVEAAVNRVLAHGGHVEVITDNPALEQIGRIGAILRY